MIFDISLRVNLRLPICFLQLVKYLCVIWLVCAECFRTFQLYHGCKKVAVKDKEGKFKIIMSWVLKTSVNIRQLSWKTICLPVRTTFHIAQLPGTTNQHNDRRLLCAALPAPNIPEFRKKCSWYLFLANHLYISQNRLKSRVLQSQAICFPASNLYIQFLVSEDNQEHLWFQLHKIELSVRQNTVLFEDEKRAIEKGKLYFRSRG